MHVDARLVVGVIGLLAVAAGCVASEPAPHEGATDDVLVALFGDSDHSTPAGEGGDRHVDGGTADAARHFHERVEHDHADASTGGDAAPVDAGDAGDAALPPEVAPGAPSVVCVQRIHGTGRQLVYGVAVANDGRIGVVGQGQDATTYDFGGGPVVGGAQSTGFIAVYDAACNLVWRRVLGPVPISSAGVPMTAVAFDAAGNLVVAGEQEGTISFAPGSSLTTKGSYDVVVAKFDTAYQLVYAKQFGDAGYQRVDGMGVDASGNVVLGGTFSGAINFGGGALVAPTAASFQSSVFIAKLDTNGAHVFSKAFALPSAGTLGSAGDFQLSTLDVGPSGDIALGGLAPSNASIDLGGGPLSAAGPTAYFRWAAHLGPAGEHLWSKAWPVIGLGTGRMTNGDVVLSIPLHSDSTNGPVGVTIDFGKGPVSGAAALVRTSSSDGSTLWSKSFPASGKTVPTSTGGMLFSGAFTDTIDVGCGPLTSAGALDIVLARLSASGDCLYSLRFGDAKHQFLSAATVAPSGHTVLVGSYHGTIRIGATTLPNDDTRVTSDPQGDSEDGFVAVLSK